jgi:23S rRNA (pseudouridine1915-N3)-methyltransferase
MHLSLLAVGNKMPSWISSGYEEYAKRLPPDWRLTLKEIKPEARTSGKTPAQMMTAEAERLRNALPKQALIIALDERGENWTTAQLSQHLSQWQHEWPEAAFVIGGADGLDPAFKQQARYLLRISSMTLPHGMVRVLLAEQLYRAWSLMVGHPYHRE